MSSVALRRWRSFGPGGAPADGGQTVTPSCRIATVTVHADPRDALADWHDLSRTCATTPYQTPGWLLPWIETMGEFAGVAPLIVVARDASGRPAALLPLGVQRRGTLAVAGFLGGRDSNFNMGLFTPGHAWNRPALHDLLRRAAAASPRRIDLFAFRNQPHGWADARNPLLALAHQPSPSFAYKARLQRDPEAFSKSQLSRESRKKLRQKMNRLRAMGAVEVVDAATPALRGAVLDAFVAQRTSRNAALGLGIDDLPALRRFLDRTVGAEGPISFRALRCGGRIVATLAGARRGDRFSGMLTSFTSDPDFARTSPGELLLAEVMRESCEAGLATFDLGIGEARYKDTHCPEAEPLFDSFVPMTALGHAFAAVEGVRLRLKRAIKQSDWAWPLVLRLRRLRAAAASRADGEGE